jgi:diguanylate cyclase (GGDEF)-like protein
MTVHAIAQIVPSRRERWAAGLICCGLVVLAGLTLPNAGRPLGVAPSFLPIYLTLAAAADGFTAFLLLLQFRAAGYTPFALLSFGYATTATLIVAQACAFPGVLAPAGLFGARPQTAVWIWTIWHGGFPLMIAFYALSRRFFGFRVEPNLATVAGLVVTSLLSGLVWALIAYNAPLPTLVVGKSYAGGFHGTWQTVIAIAVISLVATALLTRFSNALDVWLSVALVGTLCEVVLTLAAGARFSAGWYLARVYAVLTSLTVASLFIAEFSRLYTRFARLASVDPLTGLANRRSFDERLDEELRAAAREKAPLSMLMIDVDDFKRYNDAHGHIAGDDALCVVANAIRTVSNRPRDIVARFGGEEFVVVLPGTDLDGSGTVGERIRAEVERRRIAHRASRAAPVVTISVGAACAWMEELEARALIERADAALYAAKRAGRNRVAIDGGEAVSV